MSVLFSDFFTRSNSATTLGSPWTIVNGTGGISSNEAYFPSDANGNLATLPTVGTGDYVLSCSIKSIDDGSNYSLPNVLFRYIDASTFLRIRMDKDTVLLSKYDAGSETVLASYAASYTSGTFFTVSVICFGNSIKGYVDGVQRLSYTLTAPEQTKYGSSGVTGIRLSKGGSPGSSARWDDLSISTVGTTGATTYATKQVVNRSSSTSYDTKQIISQSSSVSLATQQQINQTGSVICATKQVITDSGVAGSVSYSTMQSVYQLGSLVGASKQSIYRVGVDRAATKQVLFSTTSVLIPLKVCIFTDGSITYSTKQVIFDPTNLIVGRIQLHGERKLRVKLLASRELHLKLRGDISMAKIPRNFEMWAGETKFIDVDTTDDGDVINLTGATIKWVMKRKQTTVYKDTVNGGITITDAANGLFTINLGREDTTALYGDYEHEAEIIDALGNESTVLFGRVSIAKSIVRILS
jgi:hypothetical protein